MTSVICFFKQKTAYEMRISDWSSDVCSSDLRHSCVFHAPGQIPEHAGGRAPDPVLLPLQLEERHIDAFTRQDLALEVRAAGELLEWQLEDLGDFAVVDMQLRLNVDDADHRRDAVTAQCQIGRAHV